MRFASLHTPYDFPFAFYLLPFAFCLLPFAFYLCLPPLPNSVRFAHSTHPKIPFTALYSPLQPFTASRALPFGMHQPPAQPLPSADQTAAQMAWRYFEHNWNAQTGLVNAIDGLTWTTLWDQGSAIFGLHATYQLQLLPRSEFQTKVERLLLTLQQLPLPATGLPNKAYSTADGSMRTMNNRADLHGRSGWSVLDMARYLTSLYALQQHYPCYREQIQAIVARYNLKALIKDGWLQGSGNVKGTLRYWQEGRLGYEQYAANSLLLWGLDAPQALYYPPVNTVLIEDVLLLVDKRDRTSSGASNYLTSDPYLLWSLELGLPPEQQIQVQNLFQAQVNRCDRTGTLTAVNEDACDRAPYFLYYNAYADGQTWTAIDVRGRRFPKLRCLSTKAAFAWHAICPDHAYGQTLRQFVQSLADPDRGYFAGMYEDPTLGMNQALSLNTNAVVLESLLFQSQGYQPLLFNHQES